jgi:hypothetical protein
MTEKYYAFLKNNVVEDILVFEKENQEVVDLILSERGFDEAIWLDENKPNMYSSYDPKTKKFTNPTLDYLYERGLALENQAMLDARIAKEAEQATTPTE